jgi:hypothetical protein
MTKYNIISNIEKSALLCPPADGVLLDFSDIDLDDTS